MQYAPPSYQIGLDDPTAPLPRGAMPVSLLKRVPGTETYRGPVRTPAVGFEDPTARPFLNVPGSKPEGERVAGATMSAPSVSMTRQVLETPLITPEDIDENFPFLVGPFRLHAGMMKAGAAMTTPENAAITAGTAGLGAVPGVTASLVRGGLSAYFATGAGKALAEKYPQIKERVKAKDWQGALELGGGALVDAAIVYGAGKHAAGEIFKRAPAEARANYVRKVLRESEHRATSERERVHSSAPTSPLNLRDPQTGVAPEPKAPEAPVSHESETPYRPAGNQTETKPSEAPPTPTNETPAPEMKTTTLSERQTEAGTIAAEGKMPESKPAPTKESFLKTLHDDTEGHHNEYTRRFGNVLNADNAATLFDDYTADPAANRVPVHEAASEIRDSLFEKKLAESAPEGKDAVVFTAGGNASGKSTIAELSKAGEAAHVVLDSTFSNTDHARSLVDKALAASKPVLIQHVVRPVGEAFRGMLERAKTEGRVVSIRQMLNSERGALGTVRDLQQEFADDPRVAFRFYDNSGASPRETAAPPELKGYAESKAELHDILDSEYHQGRISEDLYRRIGGTEINRGIEEVRGRERSTDYRGSEEAAPGALPGTAPEQRNESSVVPPPAPEPSASVPEPDRRTERLPNRNTLRSNPYLCR